MSARAAAVLSRFPGHLAVGDPGKLAGEVVGALADLLDVLTRQVGDVRGAHRLAEVPTTGDLLGLAGLHRLAGAALEPLQARLQALAEAAAADPPDPARIGPLVNLPAETLAALGEALADLAGRPARHRPSLRLTGDVTAAAIAAHRAGNATPAALLAAAAAYLGLAVEAVVSADGRWWHLATCRERLRLEPPPSGPDGTPAPVDLTPPTEVLALEENPFHGAELDPAPRRHGQRFRVLRGGLEDVDATVLVRGIGSRTVRPMVVHVDAGRGLVYEGDVADGAELAFGASGRVTLAGSDVTGSAWAFEGAVFASTDEALPEHDFEFADADAAGTGGDREATFVVTTPVADALDPAAAFPHGAAAVSPLRLPLGESRWACFVRVAHAGAGADEPAVPRTSAGRFDQSVFGDAAGPMEPSLAVGFRWEEREPFAVRVLLPRRLSAVDDEQGSTLRQPLRLLLDRHRAAGVDLRTEYADPRWTLGTGVVREGADDPIGSVLSGTELWPDGTPQPAPAIL